MGNLTIVTPKEAGEKRCPFRGIGQIINTRCSADKCMAWVKETVIIQDDNEPRARYSHEEMLKQAEEKGKLLKAIRNGMATYPTKETGNGYCGLVNK